MKILIYAPSQHLTQPLVNVFTQIGLWTETCASYERLYSLSLADRYAAIVLWHEDEPEVLLERFARWKRNSSGGRFIVLTARQSGVERARALEAGVDRYLIAPFSYAELAGDLILKEYDAPYDASGSYATKHFQISPLSRAVSCDGESLHLTRREFDILAYLIRHRGQTLSRLQIWEEVWGIHRDMPAANPIDVHINRLRHKLPPECRPLIRAVYGIGYRMHAEA